MNPALLIVATLLITFAAYALCEAFYFRGTRLRQTSVRPKSITANSQAFTVNEWAHGRTTKNVFATRYTSSSFGFYLGFKFPNHPSNCDRSELIEFMRSKGANVFQCGGFPGAEVLATVKGVNNIEAANAFLKEFLPELDRVITSL
jgi:hypothetical protein